MSQQQSAPARHLARLTALFPKFTRAYDLFRGDRDFATWPSWCYCPLSGAYAVVSGGGDNRASIDRLHLVGELGAVAAWRPTKGIYRFDPDLATALIDTPLDRELPDAVLQRLPEWCVWIDPVAGLPGFFAYLEHDHETERAELRLEIDDGVGGLLPTTIHLGTGSLLDGLEAACLEGPMRVALRYGVTVPTVPRRALGSAVERARGLVALVLYLCSDEPDFDGRLGPVHPGTRKRRATGAQQETLWTVGERVGAALRSAIEHTDSDGDGSHSSPRPHVRRAHWHTYWVGPKTSQSATCKWLSPILVGAGDTIPTTHEVT